MKNKMFVYGWRSTFDDQLSDLSNKRWLKCKKTEKGSHVIDKLNVHFWITFNFWWSAEKSEWWASTKMQKNEERPSMSSKKKCLVLDYVQLLMISWVIWVTKGDWNVEKGPPSHQKIKYSFLYYTQLLIIRQVIWVMKVDQNAKKWHVASVRVLCCFSLGLLLFQSGSSVCPPPPMER